MSGRPHAVLGAMILAAVLPLAAGCGGDQGRSPSPAAASDNADTDVQASELQQIPVEPAAATTFAVDFARLFGSFSPIGDQPGVDWVNSWASMTSTTFQTSINQRFDQFWSWTWAQRVATMDVTPTAPPTTQATDYGTVVVDINAKRYVVGLQGADSGRYDPVHFDITVGPNSAAPKQLQVYGATMERR